MKHIRFLNEVSFEDNAVVGGKAAALGELINSGITVPMGFVVIVDAYHNINIDLQKEIVKAFNMLGVQRVAVRSSAITEDSPTASWAGQLESYLNIHKADLFKTIIKCWRSTTSERARFYAKKRNIAKSKLKTAVIIQKMIDSDISGVMFTNNPLTHNKNELMIEACFGLGEPLVQGEITPDNYIIDKKTLKISKKPHALVLDAKQLKTLTKLGITIEKHFRYPQDIEWTFSNNKLYVLQSRPITTLNQVHLL